MAAGSPVATSSALATSSAHHEGGNGCSAVTSPFAQNERMMSAMQHERSKLLHFPMLSQVWTLEEQRLLDQGLMNYPAEDYPPLVRYIKIAAMLPEKTVRDVALRFKWMQRKDSGKRRRPEDLTSKKSKEKKGSENGNSNSKGSAGGPLKGSWSFDDGLAHAGKLLDANVGFISQIRSNLAACKIQDNVDLFVRVRDNINSILQNMATMPGAISQMPPLPSKLDVELMKQFLPQSLDSSAK